MPNSIWVTASAADGGGLAQHPLGRPTGEQAMEHAGQQGIAGAHRAGHFHPGRHRLPGTLGGEPADALGALGNHHLLDTARTQ